MNQRDLIRLGIAILTALLAFLKFLADVVSIRPVIERVYGLYILGLCDTVVGMATGILLTIGIVVALVSVVRMAHN